MLQIRNLRKSFGDLQVLKSIDLDVNKGDVVAILGPSGSGKTTMLRCLNFLEKSDGGTMLFDDQRVDLARVTHAEANALRRRTGFVFQSYNLIDYLTPVENVKLGGSGNPQALLTQLGIGKEYWKRSVLQLSGGQQQRVAIARALASDAKVLLADEPTGNLDEATAWDVIEILKEIAHKEKKCVIVVTHSKELASEADMIIRLGSDLQDNPITK